MSLPNFEILVIFSNLLKILKFVILDTKLSLTCGESTLYWKRSKRPKNYDLLLVVEKVGTVIETFLRWYCSLVSLFHNQNDCLLVK